MAPSRRTLLAAAAATAAGWPGRGQAQRPYPARPVRLIVAWAPTGSIDTVARKVAQKLSEQMGQSFVVENRSGGSGSIGAAEAARAAPDGYTLFALDSTYGMMPFLRTNMPFNHAEAFQIITITAFTPVMVAVHRDSPWQTLQELTDAARRAPETITYGSGGIGSAVHFSTAAYELEAGVKLFHVPYRGGGEAVTAVLSKQVDVVFASPGSAIGGATAILRPLAISGTARMPALPDTPTFAEAGLPGYSVTHWSGLAAPRGTPAAVIDRLYEETAKALATPDVLDFFGTIACLPGGAPPAEVERLLAEETVRWRRVVAAAGIQPQ
jgi:tripartite-type tricarboxylate transporter receptor subunit TctC